MWARHLGQIKHMYSYYLIFIKGIRNKSYFHIFVQGINITVDTTEEGTV